MFTTNEDELYRHLGAIEEEMAMCEYEHDRLLNSEDGISEDYRERYVENYQRLAAEYDAVSKQLRAFKGGFKRPGGVMRVASDALPPLPSPARIIHLDTELLKQTPETKFLALLTVLAIIGAMIATMFIPGVGEMPFALLSHAMGNYGIPVYISLPISALLLIAYYLLVMKYSKGGTPYVERFGGIIGLMLWVEHIFHLGAEKWSFGERVRAALIFGAVTTLPLFPLAVTAGAITGGFIIGEFYRRMHTEAWTLEDVDPTDYAIHASSRLCKDVLIGLTVCASLLALVKLYIAAFPTW